ncbi:two-component sensor histidine kinase [Nitrobacteraceae bacterium AZCC 1564]
MPNTQKARTLSLVRDTGVDPETLSFISATEAQLSSVLIGLLDQSDDCVKVLSPDGRLKYMSCNGRVAMQVDNWQLVYGQFWWDLWPESAREIVRESVLTAVSGRSVRFDGYCPTVRREPRWWDVYVSPLRDSKGSVCALLSTSRDISNSRRAQESLETIALEMRHRLRNAFTLSAAVAEMSGRNTPEHREFAKELSGRFMRLGVAQTRILDAVSGAEPLPALIATLVGVFDERAAVLKLGALPDVSVSERPSRAVALALGELCTNSMKYGALRHDGTIDLRGENIGSTVMLRWSESLNVGTNVGGARTDRSATGSGSGLALIRRMLESHGGRLDVRWTATGLEVSILLDLADRVSAS